MFSFSCMLICELLALPPSSATATDVCCSFRFSCVTNCCCSIAALASWSMSFVCVALPS